MDHWVLPFAGPVSPGRTGERPIADSLTTTVEAVQALGLSEGAEVIAVIKASDVILATN